MTFAYSPTIRRILFFSVITFFIVSSIVLITYSFGYRYNFEKGIFIYTGSITLKTNPQQVSIYLNGKDLKEDASINFINSSYQINSLRPGKYRVDISAPGFQTWSKFVTVESGKSTEFWNIFLPRESYETQDINIRNISGMYPSPDSDEIAISRLYDNTLSVDILDSTSLKTETIFTTTEYRRPQNWRHNIEWSPNSEMLLIPVLTTTASAIQSNGPMYDMEGKNRNPDEIILYDRNKNSSIALSEILLRDSTLEKSFRDIRWGSGNNDIYVISGKTLLTLQEMTTGEWKKSLLYENILSYNFTSSHAYILKENGIITKTDKNWKNEKQITTSQPQEFDPSITVSLIMYDESRGVIQSQNGNLWIWNRGEKGSYYHLRKDTIVGTQFSNDGKKLLFWSDRAIWVYFLRDWETQPSREENTFFMISNFLSPIDNVSWTKQYEHILYTFEGRIHTAELDQRDYRVTSNLSPTVSKNPAVLQIFNEDKVFFSKPNENGENILSSFIFPEKITFFGF